MATIKVVRGDANFPITMTIKNAEGDIVDISNSTVKLKVQRYTGSTLVFTISEVIVDGSDGVVAFGVTDEIVDISGDFIAEVEINYDGGKVLTAPSVTIKILEDLPRT